MIGCHEPRRRGQPEPWDLRLVARVARVLDDHLDGHPFEVGIVGVELVVRLVGADERAIRRATTVLRLLAPARAGWRIEIA